MKKSRQRYNIALLPEDGLAADLINYAQRHFRHSAEGYLLSHGKALPHVTLVQFYLPKNFSLDEIRQALRRFKKFYKIYLSGLLFRSLDDWGRNNFWSIWVDTRPDKEILDLRQKVFQLLEKAHCQYPPTSEEYDPHITLCVMPVQEKTPSISWLPCLGTAHRFQLGIGLSDDIGQFQKPLFELAKGRRR
ncbi:MAG: 2'-5' RNA ligase family protein [Dongiaceae bacterium]